ncbi:MAG: hypothetical protein RR434_03095, partial [Raoultibacter sp.]
EMTRYYSMNDQANLIDGDAQTPDKEGLFPAAAKADAGGVGVVKKTPAAADAGAQNPFFRAANEDDDGYDPYSDRVEKTSLFEEDPWR